MKKLINENRRGLVGHWKYHGNVSTSGTWYDISGNGNNGTLNGNAFVDSNGLNLDGTGDYVQCGTNLLGQSYSIVVWFKLPTGSSGGTLFAQYDYISYAAGRLNFNVADQVSLWEGGGGGNTLSTTIITKDIWYMAVATNHNKAVKLYINGVEESTNTFLYYPPNIANFIGTYAPTEGFINALMDDIRLYNRALSAEEVAQIYYQTKWRY